MTQQLAWPNGKSIAVSVTVMFETWSEGGAPTYSVQTTQLKPGTIDHAAKAWSTYGGRVGVWRLIRLLDRLQIPATFFASARCAEEYPDAVKEIVSSGHDLAAHGYAQDQLLAYMTPDEQQKSIRHSVDLLESGSGQKIAGWLSPVLAFTPETNGFLAQAGLKWTADVTYADLPIQIRTPHGTIAGVPTGDFSDNRVLRASPRDLYEALRGMFDYLVENEPMGLLVVVMHCQFGGRPLITSALQELLKYLATSPSAWFARHEELANWALAGTAQELTYRHRFFGDGCDRPSFDRQFDR